MLIGQSRDELQMLTPYRGVPPNRSKSGIVYNVLFFTHSEFWGRVPPNLNNNLLTAVISRSHQ